MSPSRALEMPCEIWLTIAGHLRPNLIYYIRSCCSEPFPSPGAGIVGPLYSSAPTRDLINLSCVCRTLRSMLEDDVKAVLSLYLRRCKDDTLVHQPRSGFPLCGDVDDKQEYSAADIHEIAKLPLGNHIRHLRLALREFTYHGFEVLTKMSQEYCDDAAPILYGVPCLQSLKVSAIFGSTGHPGFNLSPTFCQALASLQYLHTLKILGLTIPAGCPTLPSVEHIQTDAEICSFESFPRLKDLRQVPDRPVPNYIIPGNVLAQLEILHYCPPYIVDECALLPHVCRVRIFIKRKDHIADELSLQSRK